MSKFFNPSDAEVFAMTENEKVAAAVCSFILPALGVVALLGAAIGLYQARKEERLQKSK